jgi:hypothetical protein
VLRAVYPGSRILIFTHPRSRIPDPKTTTKDRGEKNLLSYLFCSHKFHKIANYFLFIKVKKKIWSNFQKIIELFTQNIVTKLSKIWFWDPDPGSRVKKAPGPGSGSAKLHKTKPI